MMKRLLTMAFAAVFAVGAFAQDYVYTSTQRLKITGDNIVTNGNFAEGTTGWVAADGGDVNATIWTLESGVGPAGENALKSLGNEAADANALCQRWAELSGTYVITLQMKGTAYTNTAIGAAQNSVDFFLNTDGAYVKAASTEEAPVVNVAAASHFAEDWTTLTFVANIEAGQFLVMNIQQLATDAMVTNIQIRPAEEVYDTRGVEQTIAFAKKLMDDPNFNTDQAANKRAELAETVELIEGLLSAGSLDDESTAAAYVEILNTVFGEYMDVTSVDLTKIIPGLDISSLSNWGRGGAYSANYKLNLGGGNWGHLNTEQDVLRSAIQTGYGNYVATYEAAHEDLPSGKYFFTCEIRNANTGKDSWPCVLSFNLETTCKMFVGKDTIEVGPIKGEDFQQYYLVADVADDGAVRAGVVWPGSGNGGSFMVRNTQMRAFNPNVEVQVEHTQAFKNYKAQWDAAIAAQKKVRDLTGDPNYPWGQDSLARASAKWDPYVESHRALNWQNADGTDALVASTEDLNDWAKYQGVDEYSEPTEENPEPVRKEFQLVRGFQYAASYVIDRNKPFTDLANAIDEAKKIRNNSANATGDRALYRTAIVEALNVITTTRATTTDATYEADAATLAQAKEALDAATKAFLASAVTPPVIDIDFENPITEVTVDETTSYVVQGAVGMMTLSNPNVPWAAGQLKFEIGYKGSEDADVEMPGVLRLGNGSGTVVVPEGTTIDDDDMVEVSFDLWQGYLVKKAVTIEVQNAAGESLAKIVRFVSNGTSTSTMGVEEGDINKYITVRGSSSIGNAGICVDANKVNVVMTFNYGAMQQQLTLNHKTAGTFEGPVVDYVAPASGDFKIGKFIISTNYNSADARRSWFDNLTIKKFKAVDYEEDIPDSPWAEIPEGIQSVGVEKGNMGAIYTLSGVKVTNASKPGIYILNGKKFVVK